MKVLVLSMVLFALILLAGCNEEMPLVQEGNTRVRVVVVGDTTVVADSSTFVPLQNAKVILSSEYGVSVRYTDENGILILDGIPSSTYSITARLNHPRYQNILLVGTAKGVEIVSGKELVITIQAEQVANTGIALNEIYSVGPVNGIFFFFDQFVELYNYSDETKYLDGMIIARVSGNSDGKGPGADEGDDGDLDGVTYIFQFPGKPGETNHPFYPATYQVLAVTAINHKNSVAAAVDLSRADWEFYNQYSTTDFDNPAVPNLSNIRADRTVDFLISLNSDVIMLASGVDAVWEDGIDLSTVIDGIEYQSSTTSAKTLDARIDKSFALSPPKYSGQSMQRREPGGDSNDGISDWEILPAATPGGQ